VVPGACLLQIVNELMAMSLDTDVRLIRADQIKFISMIGPDEDETVCINITWDPSLPPHQWQVTAEGVHADEVFFRFKGTFQAGSDYAG
jgi:3-hydroxyacyl-[acyl-carrier-protein] dehydratase